MYLLPELPVRKKSRPAYKKSAAVKELERMADAEARLQHPNVNPKFLAPRKYKDNTANGLTKCVIDFIRLSGYQAERINCTGRFVDNTEVVENVLGDKRRIGSAKWLPTSGQRGTADISACIAGKSVKVEVKIHDRQSEAQKAYQAEVERAGGVYLIVRSFTEFYEWMTAENDLNRSDLSHDLNPSGYKI